MKFVLLLSIVFSSYSYAYKIESKWSSDYTKSTIVTCSEEEYFCMDLCSEPLECIQPEGYCKDCASTGIFSTNIFKYIGLSIVNSNVRVIDSTVEELIRSKEFITLSSKSIFNHLTRFNSKALQRQFISLCEDTEYPHIIISVTKISRTPINAKYVSCNNGLFELKEFQNLP